MDSERADDEAERVDATEGEVGDVEAAGETTAAVAITGPADTRPVRPDLSIKIADTPEHDEER